MKQLLAEAGPIVRNDLRIFWRSLQRKNHWSSGIVPLLVLAVLMHGAVGLALLPAKAPPPAGVQALLWVFVMLLLVGGAMNQAITLLFTRSDFDLLLSSPLPARSVLLGRLGSVALASFLSVGLFMIPMINGAILRFSPRFAAAYLVFAEFSVLAAAIGVALTLLLVRLFGVRIAHLLSMLIAGVLGASVSLLSLIPALVPKAKFKTLQESFNQLVRHPAVSFVGEANQGSPLPLLALGLVAGVAVALTVRLLSRVFVAGLHASAGVGGRRRARRPHRWSEGLLPTVVRKEFRLLARSPMLIMQLLPGLLLALPTAILVPKTGGLKLLPPLALFIASFFTFLISDVSAAGEVGWDLVRLSPQSVIRLRRLKMVVCTAVPLLIATLLAGWIAWDGHPWLALLTVGLSALCSAGCAWIGILTIQPSPRYDLVQTSAPSLDPRQMLSLLVIFPGAIGLGLLSYDFKLLAVPFLGGAVICVVACFVLLEPRTAD